NGHFESGAGSTSPEDPTRGLPRRRSGRADPFYGWPESRDLVPRREPAPPWGRARGLGAHWTRGPPLPRLWAALPRPSAAALRGGQGRGTGVRRERAREL